MRYVRCGGQRDDLGGLSRGGQAEREAGGDRNPVFPTPPGIDLPDEGFVFLGLPIVVVPPGHQGVGEPSYHQVLVRARVPVAELLGPNPRIE